MLVREKREKVSKILIITNHSYMFYRFRLELIQELMKDHEVVLSMPFVGHEEDFMDMGLRCINTELDRRSINPKKDIKLFSFYWKLLKEEKPDMVITYSIKPNVYAGLACAVPDPFSQRQNPAPAHLHNMGYPAQHRQVLRIH